MLELDVDSTNDFQLRRAQGHYASGRLNEARRMLVRRLSREPGNGRCWELLGLVQHARQQWSLGLRALEEASVLVSLSASGECALADCYLAKGRTNWARQLYCAIADHKRATVQSLLVAAARLDAMSEPRMAIIACRRAIQIDPEAADSYFSLSYYLRRSWSALFNGQSSRSTSHRPVPANLGFRLGLAGVMLANGRRADAIHLFDGVTFDQVQSIQCRCCLERMMDALESNADDERVLWCCQRLECLEARGRAGR